MQIVVEAKKTETTAWIKRNVNETIDIKGTVRSERNFTHLVLTMMSVETRVTFSNPHNQPWVSRISGSRDKLDSWVHWTLCHTWLPLGGILNLCETQVNGSNLNFERSIPLKCAHTLYLHISHCEENISLMRFYFSCSQRFEAREHPTGWSWYVSILFSRSSSCELQSGQSGLLCGHASWLCWYLFITVLLMQTILFESHNNPTVCSLCEGVIVHWPRL